MYRVIQLDASAYHVANLLLHGTVGALVVLLVHRVTRSLLTGLLAAVIFVIAPTYWTSVVWVSNATTLIAATFAFGAVVLYLRYVDVGERPILLGLGLAAFALALLAKETSFIVPGLMAVLGFAVWQQRGEASPRRFLVALTPFVLMDLVYLFLQLSQVYGDRPASSYEIGWHVVPNLLDRILWLSLPIQDSLPLRASQASWVVPAQWASLTTFATVAGVALVRRQWVLPALFLATLLLLLPSSLFTRPLNPRWMYLASVPWSGFVAVIAVHVLRQLSQRHVLLGVVGLGVMVATFYVYLLPVTIDGRDSIERRTHEMEDISDLLQSDCSRLGPGRRLFLFPIEVPDPGFGLPAIARLHYPETEVLPVWPPLVRPTEGDCVLDVEVTTGTVRATDGGEFVAGQWWDTPVTAPCPEAVHWEEARSFFTSVIMVQGPIVAVVSDRADGRTQFLVGEDSSFSVFATKRAFDSIPVSGMEPEDFVGSTICASGIVGVLGANTFLTAETPSAIAIDALPSSAPRDSS